MVIRTPLGKQQRTIFIQCRNKNLGVELRFLSNACALAAFFLVSCGSGSTEASADDIEAVDQQPAESPLERALLEQVSCVRLPQASVAMNALLRRHAIAETDGGGDGIAFFVPTRPMSLLGFDIVRLGGWESSPDGGAMEPFGRGPGTAPPTFISIAVRGSVDEVRSRFLSVGIKEAEYVPDYSMNAFTDSDGKVYQPRRLVPGAQFAEGDNPDSYIENPVPGTTTITCSASEMDFQKEIEAQFAE